MTTTTKILGAALCALTMSALMGCAASDESTSPPTTTTADDDNLTADESSAGADWQKSGASEESAATGEHGDDSLTPDALSANETTTPEEDSAPYLLPNDGLDDAAAMAIDGEPIPQLDATEIKATKSCRKANGYRYGSRFTICITTINGKRVEVNTARAYLRMRKKAAGKGIYLYVVSGFRTMAEQRYFYHCYKTGSCNGGNLAAPPGYSNHQSGHALDLNTSAHGVYWFLSKYGSSYTFKRTVPSEAWHWERW